MSCASCEDTGLVPFVHGSHPKADADVTADDLSFAVCLCAAGQAMRWERNGKARTAPHWRVWCAREKVDTARVFLAEHVFTAGELQAAGLTVAPASLVDRRAALLAEGNKKR